MKKLYVIILIISSFDSFAQTESLSKDDVNQLINPINDRVKNLQVANSKLQQKVASLNAEINKLEISIDSLLIVTKSNSNGIIQTRKDLGLKISDTEKNTNEQINKVGNSLSQNSLFGIIGVLSAILLSVLLYWLLSKRQKIDKSDFISQLSKTKSSIEESLVMEFGKQTELMDTQIQLLEKQKNTAQAQPTTETDHSLALKVASEINLIERNINLMDSKTKGLKQLHASVGKLKDNLSANGYEMPELLGKQFHQGMKVIVTSSIPDENLEKGSEIISKVLIPQVNFNDKMIQTAQIEVSVGY
ncbi:MAG: septum formation initiator [Bacteroidetes bacterium]|nr:septum formation initiator [Bacteroidota bacterium]